MFVRSNMDVPVTYNKSTGSVVLKPNTVTFVADTLVTAEELKGCYGDRISILSNGIVEQIIEEEAPVVEDSKVETPNEGEEENKENAEGGEATGDDSDKDEESNTGDKDVDDFLNGKTDVLPEGTTEITEEEALKLKEQADAEARAKEEAEKLEALKAQEAAEKAQAPAKTNKTKANNKGKATKKNK